VAHPGGDPFKLLHTEGAKTAAKRLGTIVRRGSLQAFLEPGDASTVAEDGDFTFRGSVGGLRVSSGGTITPMGGSMRWRRKRFSPSRKL
jgi:hypothetical protein